jgi:TonB family protein
VFAKSVPLGAAREHRGTGTHCGGAESTMGKGESAAREEEPRSKCQLLLRYIQLSLGCLYSRGGSVKRPASVISLICIAMACFGQLQQTLCAKHIEAPSYPPVAWLARIAGKVTLTATIDKDGKVQRVEPAANQSLTQNHILEKAATENLEHWIFAPPPSTPFSQTITYDYQFDESLPGSFEPISKVSIDLPDRVTILGNTRFIDTSRTNNGKHR